MEGYRRYFIAIVAVYIDFSILIFFRHDRATELIIIELFQRSGCNQRLATNWTVPRRFPVLIQAFLVHIVVAVQENYTLSASM